LSEMYANKNYLKMFGFSNCAKFDKLEKKNGDRPKIFQSY